MSGYVAETCDVAHCVGISSAKSPEPFGYMGVLDHVEVHVVPDHEGMRSIGRYMMSLSGEGT